MRHALTMALVASALAGLDDTHTLRSASEGPRPRRHEPTPEEIEREKAWRARQEAEANKVRDHYRAERLARKAAAFAKRQPKPKKEPGTFDMVIGNTKFEGCRIISITQEGAAIIPEGAEMKFDVSFNETKP